MTHVVKLSISFLELLLKRKHIGKEAETKKGNRYGGVSNIWLSNIEFLSATVRKDKSYAVFTSYQLAQFVDIHNDILKASETNTKHKHCKNLKKRG